MPNQATSLTEALSSSSSNAVAGLWKLAKEHPLAATTVVGTLSVLGYFAYRAAPDWLNRNNLKITKEGVELTPMHMAKQETGTISSGGTTNLHLIGKNPAMKTGDVRSGKDTRLSAIDADTKPEVLEAIARLKK